MLVFSIKNVFRKKSIAILSATGIGFGLMLMIVLNAFSVGFTVQIEENFSELVGVVEIQELGQSSSIPVDIKDLILEEFKEEIIGYNVLVELPIDFTLPYLSANIFPNDADRISIIGIEKTLDNDWNGPTTKIQSGSLFNQNAYEVILDSRLTQFEDIPNEIGKQFPVYTSFPAIEENSIDLDITGIYNQEESGAPSFVPRTYNLYVGINTAWNLLGQIGEVNNSYTKISLRFPSKNLDETNYYVDQFNNLSKEGKFGNIALEAYAAASFQEALEETFGLFDAFVSVISIITAIAGGMAIVVSQLNSVNQRKKEFAILKSTGWKNRHIFKNILYESLTMGVLGALIGIVIGLSFILFLTSGGGVYATVTPGILIQVIVFALIIGAIGGLYPGLKAMRVKPVETLKGE